MLIPHIARDQHGVFSREQARAEGFSWKAVRRRVADGDWQQIVGDVFAVGEIDISPTARAQAAVLATGGVVSHHTAAFLHGFGDAPGGPYDGRGDAHVTVRPRVHPEIDGVIDHRLRLGRDDITTVHGIETTSRSRTVLDLMAILSRTSAAGLMFRAVQQRWITPEELALSSSIRRGMHGTPQVRELARLVGTDAHSLAEAKLHQVLRSIPGLRWRANVPIVVSGRRFVVDVLLGDGSTVIEMDGQRFHSSTDQFQADRERQNALVSAGFTVLRFTWFDVVERPHVVAATVRRAAA